MKDNNNVYQYINQICRESYMQPKIAEQLMRKSLNANIKYQNKLWTKNFLQRVFRQNIATDDVYSYAKKQQKLSKNKNTFKNIVKQNMKRKLDDAIEELNEAKQDMVQSKIKLKSNIKQNTVTFREYENIVDNVWNKSWNAGCKKCDKKVKELEEKHDQRNHETVHKEDHTLVSKVKFKDSDMTNIVYNDKPVNLGVEKLDKNVEKVLCNPPGHAVYKKINEDDIEIAYEESIAKYRWSIVQKNKNKKDHVNPEDNSNEGDQMKSTQEFENVNRNNENHVNSQNVHSKTIKDQRNPSKNNEDNDEHKIFDIVENKLNLQGLRSTDMKGNKRVYTVEPSDIRFETKSENLLYEMKKTVKLWKSENKNEGLDNLDSDEKDGVKKLETMLKNKEIVVGPTDKSKKFTIDKPVNFLNDMKVHISDDPVVDKKFVNRVHKTLNDTSKSFVKIFQIGKQKSHLERIMRNMHVQSNTELPVLDGFHKDHKTGRKKRALVNGNIGPVSNLSEILSLIVRSYNEEMKVKLNGGCSIKSTEELLYFLEQYNGSVTDNNYSQNESTKFVASMDIESLYPSLDSEKCADTIKNVAMESAIEVEGLNVCELGIFLRKNLKSSEIEDMDYKDFIPSKSKKSKDENKTSEWNFTDDVPNKNQVKAMLAKALSIGVKISMKNHIYI